MQKNICRQSGSIEKRKFRYLLRVLSLPTYPTLLAAVEMDDTGSTKIGKYVFNHSFIIPGLITVALSVILVFLIGGPVI